MKKTNSSFAKMADRDLLTDSLAGLVGFSVEEFARAKRLLGRELNKVEAGIIGALWSEHCSYKSSKAYLSKLPSTGPDVVVGPGENAGAVDIGEGLALVFKIESHNHPSFIEPFQGAATGVGGILRDIFTMGARPFVMANLLRFGEPAHKKVPYLFNEVVRGISHYGNCFGVATVHSDIAFDQSYNGNNLVNAFAMGVVPKAGLFFGKAQGVKNRVIYVGAKTGRDGIMGAVMASDVFSGEDLARPTVQVGDPFMGKLLLEACLQCFKENLVVGIQDMGAAGMSSSCFEMANRASTGLKINLDDVPLRDPSLSAYEIMLSESQERMVMVVEPKNVPRIQSIFASFGLDSVDIGHVTGDGIVSLRHHGQEVASLPAKLIIENSPRYRRPYPSRIPSKNAFLSHEYDFDLSSAWLKWQKNLSVKDLAFVTSQFDYLIGLNTLVGPNEADAQLVKIPGSSKRAALALLALEKQSKIDAYEAARRSVFKGVLALSAQGAKPVGITNCLNFGSPENETVMRDFKETIDGMADAANAFNIPVISGNVSFYNETGDQAILPTLALAMVGLSSQDMSSSFNKAEAGDEIYLLGEMAKDYAGSEFVFDSIPSGYGLSSFESEKVSNLAKLLSSLVNEALCKNISILNTGGLLGSLIKMCATSKLGAKLEFSSSWLKKELNLALLSEDSCQALVTINPKDVEEFKEKCAYQSSVTKLGLIRDSGLLEICHDQELFFKCSLSELVPIYFNTVGGFFAKA